MNLCTKQKQPQRVENTLVVAKGEGGWGRNRVEGWG